ncbi:MAG: hypothetical protein EWV80_09005 [Microcystis aeruginosa Ma_QC_B_20070730_S2]|uniref:Uncharacterized protein n=1 Tax=Microcystis aeruginosa Ma_QC_B_20070730_S2 TaxID=2486256 RepID=A0A552DUJ0_MICAE|nr:MAG: hypothetical protein EWV80_09005 [Microcystis aeruginosa Ma_QC_B_20070730_S2]
MIICHLAGLILLQSDFLAGILFPRKSLSSIYIVAINLCVLCVWSGSFHSFARKSTRIWRC